MADINVTPLVGVMLVLPTAFIVTAPLVTGSIHVLLPQATSVPPERLRPPPPIALRLDAGHRLSWNGTPLATGDLQARLRIEIQTHAGKLPEPRLPSDSSAT
nr:biopolymer transporter ExbD [Xanthomonas sp. XNM01]